jgi:hypothetical protein
MEMVIILNLLVLNILSTFIESLLVVQPSRSSRFFFNNCLLDYIRRLLHFNNFIPISS